MPVAAAGPPPRLRKAWRYAGVFGEELMVCAGVVRVGPARQAFWAVWDRREGVLRERTRLPARRQVALPGGRVVVREGDVEVDLRLDPAGEPIEVTSPHHGAPIWTRKAPVRAVGTVRIAGRALPVDAPGLEDHSAGWHARRTAWRWAAGAGRAADGRALVWNLVEGIHDGPSGSERRVWVGGVPREVGPVAFAPGLREVAFAEGGALAFRAEAVRARRDELGLVASDYEQPFGSFSGVLPGGLEVVGGRGVMERHRARW
jgi:hypothetical protein